MKKHVHILFIILTFFTFQNTFAQTATWDFVTPGEYTISGVAQITGGIAQLINGLSVSPSIIGTENTTITDAVDVAVPTDTDVLFVSDAFEGLVVVDISDPTTPTITTSTLFPTGSDTYLDISPDNNEAYLSKGGRGASVEIYDISTPGSPVSVGSFVVGNVAYDIEVSPDSNTAYLAIDGGGAEIIAIDVTNPASPSYLGSYYPAGSNGHITISDDGNTLFIAGSDFEAIDVTNPAAMVSLDTYSGVTFNHVELSSDENTAFVSDYANGIFVFDVSDTSDITLLDTDTTLSNINGLALSSDDQVLFVLDTTAGIVSFDVSDTSDISTLDTFANGGGNFRFAISADDQTAYIASSSSGLEIIDLDYTNGYASNSPYVYPNTAQTFSSSITTFTQTLGAGNAGTVTYQISNDDGTTWYYWTGAAWAATTETDGTETASATDINTSIATFDTDGGDFLFRAYLNSNGSQQVELDQVDIDYAVPSTGSSRSSGSRRYTHQQAAALFAQARGETLPETTTCTPLTQNLKAPSRNGSYNTYTGGIVTEADTLQEHLNRLGFNSGPVDGIIGPLTDGAIKRMQTSLGVIADGFVGPITRGAINASC